MALSVKRLKVALKVSRRFYSTKIGEEHSNESSKTWRNAFLFLGLPAVAAVWYNAYFVMPQHPEREEFVPYPHLRIRHRKFPWGDGDHSLFHHPYYNALPDGYEEGSEELYPGKRHH